MPGSPAFYNKVSLWMREGAVMFFISTKLSALPHPISLHPAQDATAPVTEAENLAACPGSALWDGLEPSSRSGGSHRMTLKWELQPPHLGQGCWPKGWTGVC